MAAPDAEDHHGSHRDLIYAHSDKPSMPVRDGRVDAIVVPTIRPARYLQQAAWLADWHRCPLVTLHSQYPPPAGPETARVRRLRRSNSQQAARMMTYEAIDLIAIDVPHPSFLGLPALETTRLLAGTRFARTADTSAKRNIGLILSKLTGWQRIVFLDDDIKVPNPDDLRRACALLDPGHYQAVGLAIEGFPDNSVVCHAHRETGGKQDTFVGGGALAVDISGNQSLFPSIYNEDWFYLLDVAEGLRPLAIAGTAVQAEYDPYATPARARSEELGDVLAEGVFWLLDKGLSLLDANPVFWEDFLEKRRRFIKSVLDSVVRNVPEKPLSPEKQARMAEALRAALTRLNCIRPELCWAYLKAWSADQQEWRRYLDGLPAGLPLEKAVERVRQLGVSALLRRPRRRPVTGVSLELEVWRYGGGRLVPVTPRLAPAPPPGPEADPADPVPAAEPSPAA
jgi:hypothetical protein